MTDNTHHTTVAIVGGGLSGTLVATQLLRKGSMRVKLIERGPDIGRGIAYGTREEEHLLNVPAGNMSALPDDPEHFLRWLRRGHLPSAESNTFAPRPLYGTYIQEVLREAEVAAPPGALECIHDEVVDLCIDGDFGILRLDQGRIIRADQAVLALGNFPETNPPAFVGSFCDSPRYVHSAWSPSALDGLSSQEPVLLVGTSLTAVDMAISLRERGHEASIYAVSRRGVLPNPHDAEDPSPSYPSFLSQPEFPVNLRDLLRSVRDETRRAVAQGYDWQAVVEALRPEAQALWRAMPLDEKRRFLRHVQVYWEVHRHRIAPEIGDKIQAMLDAGQLVIHAGRIQRYEERLDRVDVVIRRRGSGGKTILSVGRVINCTGPETDVRKVRQPLVKSLLAQGAIRPGPLNIGLDVDENGALLDVEGMPSQFLYTLGTHRKGHLWETIAVPEIRDQAADIAENLLRNHKAYFAQT